MNRYYIPDISQFVQEFKFERLGVVKGEKIGSILYLDKEYNDKYGKDIFQEEDLWVEFTVFWKREPEFKTIEHGDISITYKEFPEWDWDPWVRENYIQDLLKEGKIRAKYE